MANTSYIFTLPGVTKTATLILGFISVCIMAHAYDQSWYNNAHKADSTASVKKEDAPGIGKEAYFLGVIVMWFLLSAGFYICHLLTDTLEKDVRTQFLDAGYHGFGAVLMFIGSCLVISSAVSINKYENNHKLPPEAKFHLQYKSEKIAAGVLAILNSFAYGITAWVTFVGTRQQVS